MPNTSLPAPLRANEIPSFAHHSVVNRLPEIARRVLAENELDEAAQAALQALIDEIPQGLIRPLAMPGAPDALAWHGYAQEVAGQNWLDVPWFFAEEYFYQRILEATGYFDPDAPQYLQDPYAAQKRLGLETTRDATEALCAAALNPPDGTGRAEALSRMLLIDLWGNQSDLSLWPAQAGEAAPAELNEAVEHLLVDQRSEVITRLDAAGEAAAISILLDNAGFELMCDLALAFTLLRDDWTRTVHLHAKAQPVFVSDALPQDVTAAIAALRACPEDSAAAILGDALMAYRVEGRLLIHQHVFWTSPRAWWRRPQDVRQLLDSSALILCKGDANYRRLLGDLHWQITHPFGEVVDDAPVLALRTFKSEIAVGLAGVSLPAHDAQWMTNGRWGVIQRSAV